MTTLKDRVSEKSLELINMVEAQAIDISTVAMVPSSEDRLDSYSEVTSEEKSDLYFSNNLPLVASERIADQEGLNSLRYLMEEQQARERLILAKITKDIDVSSFELNENLSNHQKKYEVDTLESERHGYAVTNLRRLDFKSKFWKVFERVSEQDISSNKTVKCSEINKALDVFVFETIAELRGEILNIQPNMTDETGRPLSPLEIEIQEILMRAEAGEQVLPSYISTKNGGSYKNPVDFVERELGRYIDRFNGGNGTVLYLDQLGRMSPKFYSTYTPYISRNKKWKNLIPPKSVRLDKQSEFLKQNPHYKSSAQYGRASTLTNSRR